MRVEAKWQTDGRLAIGDGGMRNAGGMRRVLRWVAGVVVVVAVLLLAGKADAAAGAAFDGYGLVESFPLPAGAGNLDVLPDGRLISLAGVQVMTESAPGTRTFAAAGTLAGADFSSFGPAFVRVSPSGTHLAVGNGGGASFGNYQIGVFELQGMAGRWFEADHFSAAWADDRHLALSGGTFGAPAFVSLLDTASADAGNPVNPVVVQNIGGASGGIAFDAAGDLYTGNGFATSGPSGTGAVMHFAHHAWQAALAGGSPIDFEAQGTLVVDILSAGSLGFDAEGNLFVGGGEFGGADVNFAALVSAAAVQRAIGGMGAADVLDMSQVRRLDPDMGNDFNFYSVAFNPIREELYVYDGGMVHVYAVPEPGSLILLTLGAICVARRGGRQRGKCPAADGHARGKRTGDVGGGGARP